MAFSAQIRSLYAKIPENKFIASYGKSRGKNLREILGYIKKMNLTNFISKLTLQLLDIKYFDKLRLRPFELGTD